MQTGIVKYIYIKISRLVRQQYNENNIKQTEPRIIHQIKVDKQQINV